MREIKVTESSIRYNNLLYLKISLEDILEQMNAKASLTCLKNRCEYIVNLPSEYLEIFLLEFLDKLADIIAVNYKHNYFKKSVKFAGLSEVESELLITSLISADIEEDKKYAMKKLKGYDEYSIDGIFNFRMKPLKEKWKEITGYLPASFTKSQLKDFISYLIKDKKGKRVYVDGESVYDKRFNRLNRNKLLSLDSGNLTLTKEVLLSGAGEVELCSPINDNENKYLKEFYENKIYFNDSYYGV
jgi:hypothetical protein